MTKLLFATGGVPLSCEKRSTLEGVKRIKELGLDGMEIEFVHGVRLKEKSAREIGQLSQELGVKLSAHGPYYINLAALEEKKRSSSRNYILQTAQACHFLGADRFTFHPAYYLKRSEAEVAKIVEEQLRMVLQEIEESGWGQVRLSPELTGKPTQFGSLEELLELGKRLSRLHFCLDFAHAQARSGGEKNGYEFFVEQLNLIEKYRGQEALQDLYFHISGIAFGQKGEKHHLVLQEASLKWQELLQALKDKNVGGLIICESPNLEEDALLMKEYYTKL